MLCPQVCVGLLPPYLLFHQTYWLDGFLLKKATRQEQTHQQEHDTQHSANRQASSSLAMYLPMACQVRAVPVLGSVQPSLF